jgi:hypothetical protein
MVVSAQAAFQVVDDFDSLTLGNINGQNGWDVMLTSGEVVLDPAGGSNQALKVTTESGTLHKAASVAQDTTRMLFLRLRFEEHGQFSFGLSHLLNPDEFGDFGPELGMAAATASDPNNDFRVANGLTTGIYDVLETLTPTTWYNTWVLVDTTADTYQVWMNSDPGSDAQASDQLANDAAETLHPRQAVHPRQVRHRRAACPQSRYPAAAASQDRKQTPSPPLTLKPHGCGEGVFPPRGLLQLADVPIDNSADCHRTPPRKECQGIRILLLL